MAKQTERRQDRCERFGEGKKVYRIERVEILSTIISCI